MGWKKILMEDILRLAREKGSPPSLGDVMEDSKVTREEVEEAVRELERKNLARREGERIVLTEEGERAAEVIYNYHRTVERLFGHRVAHSFEHMGDRVGYIEKAGNSIPISTFKPKEEGVLVSMELENPKAIARLMGVGLIPGTRFRVIKAGKDLLVLDVSGRLVMVDGRVAGNLRGVRAYEEGSPGRPA
ncbi:FeoA domain-containing protein [Thermococcus sp.]|uniref:metal-dependent transcriptional regulator n=1 Tax=Thermococcus sp. TaxID=35749 RepID=UPI0026398BF6|nr:FeoA domain-containing protein [Thermococcus sp.]